MRRCALRTCYDHIAGQLGVAIADALTAKGRVVLHADGGEVTESGRELLIAFGLDLSKVSCGRRIFCRPCLDWSERRYHLASHAGAEICRRCLQLRWLTCERGTRALKLTGAGRVGPVRHSASSYARWAVSRPLRSIERRGVAVGDGLLEVGVWRPPGTVFHCRSSHDPDRLLRCSESGSYLRTCSVISAYIAGPPLPSRPGEFHPEPLTDPDLSLSTHPARAIARRPPPSIERRAPPGEPVGQINGDDLLPSLHSHYSRFDTTTRQSAPLRRIGTFGLAVGAACAFSLAIAGQVLTFRTGAWSSLAPPTACTPDAARSVSGHPPS
jgi:hypothetical protein